MQSAEEAWLDRIHYNFQNCRGAKSNSPPVDGGRQLKLGRVAWARSVERGCGLQQHVEHLRIQQLACDFALKLST